MEPPRAPFMTVVTDPWCRSVMLAGALVTAGFIAIVIGWAGLAGTLSLPTQVSFAVSGGLGGIALAGTGLALLDVQRRRYEAAEDQRDLARFAAELTDLAQLIAARNRTPPAANRRRSPRRSR